MAEKVVQTYDNLIIELHYCRNTLRTQWENSSCERDDDHGGNVEVYSVKGTVIPCLNLYKHNWNRSGMRNPIDYNWVGFNPCHRVQMAYLEEVVRVLGEQEVMYSVDKDTSASSLFVKFKNYLETLRRFYEMVTVKIHCWEELGWRPTPNGRVPYDGRGYMENEESWTTGFGMLKLI